MSTRLVKEVSRRILAFPKLASVLVSIKLAVKRITSRIPAADSGDREISGGLVMRVVSRETICSNREELNSVVAEYGLHPAPIVETVQDGENVYESGAVAFFMRRRDMTAVEEIAVGSEAI
jgi:hypothetical protein